MFLGFYFPLNVFFHWYTSNDLSSSYERSLNFVKCKLATVSFTWHIYWAMCTHTHTNFKWFCQPVTVPQNSIMNQSTNICLFVCLISQSVYHSENGNKKLFMQPITVHSIYSINQLKHTTTKFVNLRSNLILEIAGWKATVDIKQ